MVTTELGACEWFVWDLRRSNLIDRGQLDQVVSEFIHSNPKAEPQQLAEFLIQNGVLSKFQAERLLHGKTQGFVMGPFTLMDSLGVGSMGTVYKAVSKTDNNLYAVKVLPRRSMWNVRIARRKVRAFEACRHPAVVPFVDVGTSGGMHYLAWPFVEGTTLENVVLDHGRFTAEQTAEYAFQLAEGLEVCHLQGLFHGLFKPSNVMVTDEGDLCILDFGIGCLLAETEGESLVDTMSTANSVASGLDCASPESIMDPSNLNPIGDQYSLGCVMYFCLSARYPFPDGTAAEKMMAHQFKEPTPLLELNPDVPNELAEIVKRLMQKEPAKRFGSTAEVVESLRPFAGEAGEDLRPNREQSWREEESPAPSRQTPSYNALSDQAPARPAPDNIGASPLAGDFQFPEPAATPSFDEEPVGHDAPADARNGLSESPLASLPSRKSIKENSPPPPDKKPAKPRSIPGGFDYDQQTWEDRLGPFGVGIGALIAGVLAWLIFSRLMG